MDAALNVKTPPGAKVAVIPVGSPLAERVGEPEKPLSAPIVIVFVAVAPWARVIEDCVAVSVKSGAESKPKTLS